MCRTWKRALIRYVDKKTTDKTNQSFAIKNAVERRAAQGKKYTELQAKRCVLLGTGITQGRREEKGATASFRSAEFKLKFAMAVSEDGEISARRPASGLLSTKPNS